MRLTRGCLADRVDQLVTGATLQQIAAGSQGNRTGDIRGVVEGGEHQDGQIRLVQLDAAQGRQAVAIGHADVQEHDIHFVFQGVLYGRLSGGHLGDDLDLRVRQQGLDAATGDFVVVGNQQFDLACVGHGKSSREETTERAWGVSSKAISP